MPVGADRPVAVLAADGLEKEGPGQAGRRTGCRPAARPVRRTRPARAGRLAAPWRRRRSRTEPGTCASTRTGASGRPRRCRHPVFEPAAPAAPDPSGAGAGGVGCASPVSGPVAGVGAAGSGVEAAGGRLNGGRRRRGGSHGRGRGAARAAAVAGLGRQRVAGPAAGGAALAGFGGGRRRDDDACA